MKKRLLLLFIIHFQLSTIHCQAQTFTQEVNASAGGYYQQINGSMQFTIGEPITETYTSASGKMYSGFEQGSYVIISVNELPAIADLNVTLFPNPSSGIINLNIVFKENYLFNIVLIDALGKVVLQKEIAANNVETINLENYGSAMYYVTVSNAELGYIKTLKIIKQ